jgi:hypothetical protein
MNPLDSPALLQRPGHVAYYKSGMPWEEARVRVIVFSHGFTGSRTPRPPGVTGSSILVASIVIYLFLSLTYYYNYKILVYKL